MLSSRRKTQLVATASVFAALYAILGEFPVDKLVIGSGFLTASSIVGPVGGMLLGPLAGGFAVLLGDAIDIYLGVIGPGPIVYAVAAADVAVVATAGLAFSGRRKLAIAFPLAALAVYEADPISVQAVGPVPFVWMHVASFAALAGGLLLERGGRLGRLNPVFVVVLTWAALMTGQLVGTVVGQNLLVRFGTTSADSWRYAMSTFVFPIYPVERVFYTAAGSLVGIPVLRALSRVRGSSVRASE